MNAATEAQVVCAPLISKNPFDNQIDLITKEGISIWKTEKEPDKSLGRIPLTVKNGDKLLALTKRKCSEYRLKNSFESQPPVTASHRTYEEVPGKIPVNTESLCITITNSLMIKSLR